MQIKLKKNRLRVNLFFGLAWLGCGVYILLTGDEIRWANYGYILFGLLYIGHYLYDVTHQYLTIENGAIRKNALYGFGPQLNLNEITCIKQFGGTYTLKTEHKKLKINTNFIDQEALQTLKTILTGLNLPPEQRPCSQAVS